MTIITNISKPVIDKRVIPTDKIVNKTTTEYYFDVPKELAQFPNWLKLDAFDTADLCIEIDNAFGVDNCTAQISPKYVNEDGSFESDTWFDITLLKDEIIELIKIADTTLKAQIVNE